MKYLHFVKERLIWGGGERPYFNIGIQLFYDFTTSRAPKKINFIIFCDQDFSTTPEIREVVTQCIFTRRGNKLEPQLNCKIGTTLVYTKDYAKSRVMNLNRKLKKLYVNELSRLFALIWFDILIQKLLFTADYIDLNIRKCG